MRKKKCEGFHAIGWKAAAIGDGKIYDGSCSTTTERQWAADIGPQVKPLQWRNEKVFPKT